MWPKTIKEIADEYGCDQENVLVELRQLGVPIYKFLNKSMVYSADLHTALQKQHAEGEPSSKNQHLTRILNWFQDNGCLTKQTSLPNLRARGVYEVESALGDRDPLIVKIQVCSTMQRGKWVHFNLSLDVLLHGELDWILMVAPVFRPGTTDFVGRRTSLLTAAKDAGYRDKPAFPFRVKVGSSESYLEHFTPKMMEVIHGSHRRWQMACQQAEPSDDEG